MKKVFLCFLILIISVLFSTVVLAAGAEHVDPLTVAGDHYKLLMENERVRVLDFHGKAGDKIPMHWHPDHVVYVLSGGKANFTVNGKTTEQDMKTGKAIFMPATNHSVEVIGPGEVHVIVVELKEPAKTMKAKAK